MKQLLIGDCHFGIKSNSIQWLESQCKFFKTQIKDIISAKSIDRIVFLGDLTDIRYSLNQQIGIELKKIVRDLSESFPGQIIFIAGNHDYYSPLEEFMNYNIYNLLFGKEFLECHKNIKVISSSPELLEDGSLCLPWYYTENTDHFDEILYRYDFRHDVKCVFCHTDLSVWPGARITSLRGVPVYSGHIHYIYDDPVSNLHNIGACFPLTFADVNQSRYVYIIDDTYKITEKIKNTVTPVFKRIYNDDIFNVTKEFFDNAYVQIYISDKNMSKIKYIERLKYIRNSFESSNITVHMISDEDIQDLKAEGGTIKNINRYIEENIPDHLTDKYTLIKKKLNADS